MRGHISIWLPVKPYIRAYIQSQLGTPYIKLQRGHAINNKLLDLLDRSGNEYGKQAKCGYTDQIKVYIRMGIFEARGCNLNPTNIRAFNMFVEELVKQQFYFLMDFYIDILPSLEGNMQTVRRILGIDIEDWSDEAIRKAYYRYRKKSGKQLLYSKDNNGIISSQNVPSKKGSKKRSNFAA